MYNKEDMRKPMFILEKTNIKEFEDQCERVINEGYIPSSSSCQNGKYTCIFILNTVLNNE